MEPENCSPFFYRCQLNASRRAKSADGMTDRKAMTSFGNASFAEEAGTDRAGEKQELSGSLERPGSGMLEGE
ncbi:MAG: hypothetical protein HGB00_09795 [Chlorobiaceae bacterium]|nr:hypothetical protein [Chlorobiaceae bacterium]